MNGWKKYPQHNPKENTWCWVSNGQECWIAKYDPFCFNGWTNDDTWSDFNRDVLYFIEINKPTEFPNGESINE